MEKNWWLRMNASNAYPILAHLQKYPVDEPINTKQFLFWKIFDVRQKSIY
jgi:hypothetical protein